jgi:cerevisin
MLTHVQILAWNGGGSSNFTDIIHKGGYTAKQVEASPLPESEFEVPDVREIKVVLEKAGRKFHHKTSAIERKIEEIAEEVEELVQEELKEFFDME